MEDVQLSLLLNVVESAMLMEKLCILSDRFYTI